jgi:hypothetical protein
MYDLEIELKKNIKNNNYSQNYINYKVKKERIIYI